MRDGKPLTELHGDPWHRPGVTLQHCSCTLAGSVSAAFVVAESGPVMHGRLVDRVGQVEVPFAAAQSLWLLRALMLLGGFAAVPEP